MLTPRNLARAFALCAVAGAAAKTPAAEPAFRPPSVPLVTFNPFLSIWSPADRLTDANTVHWTRRPHPLVSLIRVDGDVLRLMGDDPVSVAPMPQTGLEVTPTRSIYRFATDKVGVTLTFMTTALPDDLDAMARPLSYLTWEVRSLDGAAHQVSLFDSTSSLLAVNQPDEKVAVETGAAGPLTWLRAGTEEQPILQSMGDDHRINWGYCYVAAPTAHIQKAATTSGRDLIDGFVGVPSVPPVDTSRRGNRRSDLTPAMAFTFDLGNVASEPVMRQVIVAYDEIYAIKYFGRSLRPFWRRNGMDAPALLQAAHRDYPRLLQRCTEFDREMTLDAEKAGGPKYAQMCALAYRQAIAGCGIAADANKQPLLFPKENSSNGCMATVDVIYPASPLFLLVSPTLLKAQLTPVLDYAASPRWKWPFAPHDLGTYPVAGGQVYGGGERTEENQMPVEESGNMLLILAGLARVEGNANYAKAYWPTLTKWAAYLRDKGLDPENQLCTDDFAGHLAHNVNLSAKAILAIAAYARMADMLGKTSVAEDYSSAARSMAGEWVRMAADGDHTRLAFDRPGTWSQKYNLVWDRLLGFDIFPKSVTAQEIAYYKTVMQRYGLPLDNRMRLTKADWTVWTATLTDSAADTAAIIDPVYDYLNATTSRLPFVDSYETNDAGSAGMRARPVIGGIFIKMLADPAVWNKWAAKDRFKAGKWAPLPVPPKVKEVVATSQKAPVLWRYTTQQPAEGWQNADFDASAWAEGPGAFGIEGTPGLIARTRWDTGDIWLRRTITMPAMKPANLQLALYHDEDAEVYVNGVLAATGRGFTTSYQPLEIQPAARALLKPGSTVTLAVHCHQTTGGQGVDAGFVDVERTKG